MDSNKSSDKRKPTLWLLPSSMSDGPVSDVLPARNIEVARSLRYFIVENVRTARRFLKRCDPSIDINELTFFVLNTHTHPEELATMLEPMDAGHDMGVISEAGCPAIADPGADIVALVHERGYNVEPLVGPSSIILGLMASGFNGQSFAFLGYLPIDARQRGERLKEMERRIMRENQTQIFIETPYRNNRLIAELVKALPAGLKLCAASDLTGARQLVTTQTLGRWASARYDYDKTPTIYLLYK